MTSADDLVADYLKRLEAALTDLPRARRTELVDEVSAHIADARASGDGATEAAIRNVLERLGDPEEIAAEARSGLGIQPVRPGSREVWALVLLAIGGIFLPAVGWIIGVVLLWGSAVWTRNEKLLGTLAVPGGLATPWFMFTFGPTESCTVVNGVERGCTSGASTLWGIAWVATIVITLVSISYLAWRLRQRSRLARRLSETAGAATTPPRRPVVLWIVLAVLGFSVLAFLVQRAISPTSSGQTTTSTETRGTR